MILEWNLPTLIPSAETLVLVQHLDGEFEEVAIRKNFGEWADDICRWAYLTRVTDMDYIAYQRKVREKVYAEYREKISNLEQQVDDLTYIIHDINNTPGIPDNCPGKCHTISRRGIKDKVPNDEWICHWSWCQPENGSDKSSSDDNNESSNARPVGEISINELRDIFLKVMREAKERERIEEDDGK